MPELHIILYWILMPVVVSSIYYVVCLRSCDNLHCFTSSVTCMCCRWIHDYQEACVDKLEHFLKSHGQHHHATCPAPDTSLTQHVARPAQDLPHEKQAIRPTTESPLTECTVDTSVNGNITSWTVTALGSSRPASHGGVRQHCWWERRALWFWFIDIRKKRCDYPNNPSL